LQLQVAASGCRAIVNHRAELTGCPQVTGQNFNHAIGAVGFVPIPAAPLFLSRNPCVCVMTDQELIFSALRQAV
jgi:hypothetical protein